MTKPNIRRARAALERKVAAAFSKRVDEVIAATDNARKERNVEIVFISEYEFQTLFYVADALANWLNRSIDDTRLNIYMLSECNGEEVTLTAAAGNLVHDLYQQAAHDFPPFGTTFTRFERLLDRYVKPYEGKTIIYQLIDNTAMFVSDMYDVEDRFYVPKLAQEEIDAEYRAA